MSGYIGTQPVPQATQTRDAFTCTAGQTSFASIEARLTTLEGA
jgi:hypothetical protein